MEKEIVWCVCVICGIRNKPETERTDEHATYGLCENGHDDWLEYRDVMMQESASTETDQLDRAVKRFGFKSRQQLRIAFLNTKIVQFEINNYGKTKN